MTPTQTSITIRPITGVPELDLFCTLSYSLNDELADDLHAGRRRPQWMWVALRAGHVVARAAWWGSAGAAAPSVLDILDVSDVPDRIAIGVQLLTAALGEVVPADARPPDYGRFVPPDWREDAAARHLVEDRMEIAAQCGAQFLVERLRLQWQPPTPVAAPAGRLLFRPVRGDAELIDLMTLVMEGTLDAHSRQDLARMTARQGAVRQFGEELAQYRSPRDWWRIAMLPGGDPVGFVIPARNDYHAIISYLGVLPAHRGNGYVDDLLAEGTRILAAQNVPRIRAATDLANLPMAAAFGRAGFVNFERAISMTWS